MNRFILATRNPDKLIELRRILDGIVPVELLGLSDVPAYDEVPETGETFADNALLKASEALAHTGLPAIADDSGLAVDALNGMPGVLSARWSGRHGDDGANRQLVLDQLTDVPDHRRGAQFVCAAAAIFPDGTQLVSHGVMPGSIVHAGRGENGFGYDPIFLPDGRRLTSGEMSAADKDAISHRGKAFRELARRLAERELAHG